VYIPKKKCVDNRTIQMVVFDVEGVILPTQRYLFEETTLLRRRGQLAVILDGFLYEVGIRRLKLSLERIYRRFRGVPIDDFVELFDRIELVPGTQEVMDELKKRNIRIALISSGIPELFVQKLAKKLAADYAVGPKLEVENGRLTGRIFGDIIDTNGKRNALSQILEAASIPPSDCIVVADDRNNLSMFQLGVLKVGFNPDFALASRSDYVIRGDLTEVLGIVLNEPRKKASESKKDYVRESIHIGSFLLPLMCQFLGFNRFLLSTIIFFAGVGYIIGEIARFRGRNLPPFTTMTRWAATGSEHWNLATAPLYLALGVILCLAFFPPPSGYVGITIVTLGDGVAKIVGRRYGKTMIPFNKPKKLEGTLAGIAISVLVASIYTTPMKALLAAGIGMLVEALPTPVNDNLLIPVVASLAALSP
jgi:HAD superfamily phosphoserine phosphatase-like hydrolase